MYIYVYIAEIYYYETERWRKVVPQNNTVCNREYNQINEEMKMKYINILKVVGEHAVRRSMVIDGISPHTVEEFFKSL